MTQHTVVVSTGHGSIVVPGHRIVAPGEEVEITNHTGGQIDLSFPNPGLWSTQPPESIENGDTQKGKVAEDARGKGAFFPYSVYCHKSGDYAEGNSHPAFIVR